MVFDIKQRVLVTGGTCGLGKAIGLEFARAGGTVFLTYRWGSADEDELLAEFRAEGLEPIVIESDASDVSAMRELMETIKDRVGALDVIVSNVAFSKVIHSIEELNKSSLDLSLAYSAWPLVDLVQTSHAVLGCYPRYVIGISSLGAETCIDGYDMASMSKAVLETIVRYLAYRLKRFGVRVNAIRPWMLDTASLRATFGDDVIDLAQQRIGTAFIAPQGVAQACVALCSGLCDSITGQVITVDEGWSLVGPMAFVTMQGLPGEFPAAGGPHGQ